jgi:hypothetical protein
MNASMRTRNALNILALYVLSIAACAREEASVLIAGEGGADGGRARVNTSQPDSSVALDAGEQVQAASDAGTARQCTGLSAAKKPRIGHTDCYVAKLVDGKPDCLAANDPALWSMAGFATYPESCGFATEFVIEATESRPIVKGCEQALSCCASTRPYQNRCYETVERSSAQACASLVTVEGYCDAADGGIKAEPDDDDAGSSVSTTFGQCCYYTCGSSFCI